MKESFALAETANRWDVHSNARCNHGMRDTTQVRRAHVTGLRLRTEYYKTLLHITSTTKYNNVRRSNTY